MLQAAGITHIVNCASECVNHHGARGITYAHLPLNDNVTENIGTWILALETFPRSYAREQHARPHLTGGILFHCWQGRNRSVTMLATHLMTNQRFSDVFATTLIRRGRGRAGPAHWFRDQLKHLHDWLQEQPVGPLDWTKLPRLNRGGTRFERTRG